MRMWIGPYQVEDFTFCQESNQKHVKWRLSIFKFSVFSDMFRSVVLKISQMGFLETLAIKSQIIFLRIFTYFGRGQNVRGRKFDQSLIRNVRLRISITFFSKQIRKYKAYIRYCISKKWHNCHSELKNNKMWDLFKIIWLEFDFFLD